MKVRGWVYIITNKAMPGLLKIGYSTKDPILRAAELGNTGAPYAYEVLYDALVDSPAELEAVLHRRFFAQREGKEWFRLKPQLAVEAVREAAGNLYLENTRAFDYSVSVDVVAAKCDYSPSCKVAPTRKFHHMAFCDEHYNTYMAGRAASRRRIGPS